MKRNILIWGAGKQGEELYEMLSSCRNCEIIAFGDNNEKLWGSEKRCKPVIGPDKIVNLSKLDCIVIAALAVEEIREQLKRITTVPILDSVDELFFKRISIDISGYCNAKCKWCVTGRKNGTQNNSTMQYMQYKEFVKLYLHLYQKGIIEKRTEVMLYSWGEPLINPDYVKIIEFLAKEKQLFSVSTNASYVQLVKKEDAYKHCCSFVFSLSGYSQESYDRIHGFRFEKIKKNIALIYKNMLEHGFAGDGSISFHVYRFNYGEIDNAKKFSDSMGLRFNPYYPYFNGHSLMEAYLENRMDRAIVQKAEEELYLDHVKELLNERPNDFRCSLARIITINWNGNLTLCCGADAGLKDFEWESVFQISSYEQMHEKREQMLQCQSCRKCRMLGIDYWLDNNPSFEKSET